MKNNSKQLSSTGFLQNQSKRNKSLNLNYNQSTQKSTIGGTSTKSFEVSHVTIQPPRIPSSVNLSILEFQSYSALISQSQSIILYISVVNTDFFTRKTLASSRDISIPVTSNDNIIEIIVHQNKSKVGKVNIKVADINSQEASWVTIEGGPKKKVSIINRSLFDDDELSNSLDQSNSDAQLLIQCKPIYQQQQTSAPQHMPEIEFTKRLQSSPPKDQLNLTKIEMKDTGQKKLSKNKSQGGLPSANIPLKKSSSKDSKSRNSNHRVVNTKTAESKQQIKKYSAAIPQSATYSPYTVNKLKEVKACSESPSRNNQAMNHSMKISAKSPSPMKIIHKRQNSIYSPSPNRQNQSPMNDYKENMKSFANMMKPNYVEKTTHFLKTLQSQSITTELQKFEVMQRLDGISDYLRCILTEQATSTSEQSDLLEEVKLNNQDKQKTILEGKTKLQESLKHMKNELISTFKQFGQTIDEKPSIHRGKKEESLDYRMAKGAGQVRKIEMQIFQVKNKAVTEQQSLSDVKEEGMDHAIALNEKLSIITKAQAKYKSLKQSLCDDLEAEQAQNQILKTQTLIQEDSLQHQSKQVKHLEQQLLSLRKQKRAILHALRSKLSEQKTYRFVSDRTLDKFYRDQLESECTMTNLRIEKKELEGLIQLQQVQTKSIKNKENTQKIFEHQDQYLQGVHSLTVQSASQNIPNDVITEDVEYFQHFQQNPKAIIQDHQMIDLMRQTLHDLDNQDGLYNQSLDSVEALDREIAIQHQQIAVLTKYTQSQESKMHDLALKQFELRSQIDLQLIKVTEDEELDAKLAQNSQTVKLFRLETNKFNKRLSEKDNKIAELEITNDLKTDEIRAKIIICERQDAQITRLNELYMDKIREKFMYRGNGDHKDRLDYFVMEYMKKNRLYIETTNVAHSLYIIGRGWAVKVQQAGDKLLVSDGPSHLSSSYIRIEKHIELNCPEDWNRIEMFKSRMAKSEEMKPVVVHETPRPSLLSATRKSPKNTLGQTASRQKSQENKKPPIINKENLSQQGFSSQMISNYLRNTTQKKGILKTPTINLDISHSARGRSPQKNVSILERENRDSANLTSNDDYQQSPAKFNNKGLSTMINRDNLLNNSIYQI